IFNNVDKNHSGKLSARELSGALMNFDNTKFRSSTITSMMRVVAEGNDSINFKQFVVLFRYLAQCRELFSVVDKDKSGDISFGEFQVLLNRSGYKLNIKTEAAIFEKFGTESSALPSSRLKFDSFIECLIYLSRITKSFSKYDVEKTKNATFTFGQFILEASSFYP
ncbi:predicted protein, partial [Scheffersomyces stipitis CBS 6054]